MDLSRYLPVVVLCASVLLSGCSRSPKEQLAYQHAEEQYQINQRNAERMREREPEQGAQASMEPDGAASAPASALRQ